MSRLSQILSLSFQYPSSVYLAYLNGGPPGVSKNPINVRRRVKRNRPLRQCIKTKGPTVFWDKICLDTCRAYIGLDVLYENEYYERRKMNTG